MPSTYARNKSTLERFKRAQARGEHMRGREELTVYSHPDYTGTKHENHLSAEIDYIAANLAGDQPPGNLARGKGVRGSNYDQIGSVWLPNWTSFQVFGDRAWSTPMVELNGFRSINSMTPLTSDVSFPESNVISWNTVGEAEQPAAYLYKWRNPYDDPDLRKLNCCRGIEDGALDETSCGRYWGPALSGDCDNILINYCVGEAGELDPRCACLKYDDGAKLPVGYNPLCHDSDCVTRGYKTKSLDDNTETCPDTIYNCNQTLKLGDDAQRNLLKNVTMSSECGGGDKTEVANSFMNDPIKWMQDTKIAGVSAMWWAAGGLGILLLLIIIIIAAASGGGEEAPQQVVYYVQQPPYMSEVAVS
jgi:hypothetical protein